MRERADEEICTLGARAVLIKGDHRGRQEGRIRGNSEAIDVLWTKPEGLLSFVSRSLMWVKYMARDAHYPRPLRLVWRNK